MDDGVDAALDTPFVDAAGDTGPVDAIDPFDVATDVSSDAPPVVSVVVYAHTASELFSVNPVTFMVTRIGAFGFPADLFNHEMTDIAVTGDGRIIGVTYNALYQIDPGTARITAPGRGLAGSFLYNALSFVPPAAPGMPERLVAATNDGGFYEIDVATGTSRLLGTYTGGAVSSGDIVSVAGAGTFATVRVGGLFGTEYLARLNDTNGAVTIIGPTGYSNTWGLGYWGGTLYGFSSGGEFITLDVTTGRGTLRERSSRPWWGAGVTTRAPLTHM